MKLLTKNRLLICLLALLFAACNENKVSGPEQVTIIKQWHLSPNTDTTNIDKAATLPQFINQREIYFKLKSIIKENKSNVIISEGCEGEIDKNFSQKFNGWDYKKLTEYKGKNIYKDILTLTPLKLEVEFTDRVKTLCGDDYKLLKSNQLALSDLRAYASYLTRLKQLINKDQNKYNMYAESLFEGKKDINGRSPIVYATYKAQESLDRFMGLITKRNLKFIELAKKNIKGNPIIVIGGLHVDSLTQELYRQKIKYTIYTPVGYDTKESELLKSLKKALK